MKKFQVFLEERGWEGTEVKSVPIPSLREQGSYKAVIQEIRNQIKGKTRPQQIEHLCDLHRRALTKGDFEVAQICKNELGDKDFHIFGGGGIYSEE
jgi:hypothetical protein